jgi:hypothetical protein
MEIEDDLTGKKGEAALRSPDVGWISMSMLAFLQRSRRQMEGELDRLDYQAALLWEGVVAGWSPEADPADERIDTVPPCSFWPSPRQQEILRIACLDLSPEIQQPHLLSCRPLRDCNGLVTSSAPRRQCPHCSFSQGLVERDTELGGVVLVSNWCAFCGWSTDAYLFASTRLIAAPLPLLAQVLLSGLIRRYRALLRVITAAVAVLLSRLRSAGHQYTIVISQRNFFTHHGAHPPRVQPARAPGLLSGMAFQPNVAA